MKSTSDLMRRISTLAFGLALLGFCSTSRAQWTAYHDHVPGGIGTQTSPNATTNKIPATGGPTSASVTLKNVANGTNLPVTMTITRSAAGVTYNSTGGSPLSGTPLFNNFAGIVYFGSGTDCNVELSNSLSGTITYTFTNLNPSKLYGFKGGAVRGNSTQTNRWTKVELLSALSYTDAHSTRVYTKTQIPSLETNQVAVSFGYNTNGEMVAWDNINPGADGSFSIVCSHYTGTVPAGNNSSGTLGFAMT